MANPQKPDIIQRAISLREAGDLDGAMGLLMEVLTTSPDSAEALLQSGVCLMQMNANEAAANALQKALASNPLLTEGHYQLGIVQRRLKQIESALMSFQSVVALDPCHANACYRAGNCLVEMGNLESALNLYNAAIERNDAIAIFYFNRGVVQRRLGRVYDAVASYERALVLDPSHGDSHFNRANLLWELGKRQEATEGFKYAVALKPVFALRPLLEQANLLANVDMWAEAEQGFEAALAMAPNDLGVMSNVASGLGNCRNFVRALEVIGEAIALEPENAALRIDRAGILRSQGALREAMKEVLEGLRLSPDLASAYVTQGAIYGDAAEYQQSAAAYRRALAIDPNLGVARYNLAFTLLTGGEYEEGFQLYEWRLEQQSIKAHQREFSSPKWDGKMDLRDKVLLVHAEQGMGDVIQFSRYVRPLADKGVRVVLEALPALVPVLSSLERVCQLYRSGEAPPAHDFHYPIMSLPFALGTRLDSVPAYPQYLSADRNRIDEWSTRLGAGDAPRVGLVWSGSIAHRGDLYRSVRLESLFDLLGANVEFHAIQTEFRDYDKPTLKAVPHLRVHAESLTDFGETAALVSLMDLIITVDTSVAHLAGALGKEVWILLPISPDWRWLLDREDSPWYPSARLFRQQSLGDWDSVLARVKTALLERFPGCA